MSNDSSDVLRGFSVTYCSSILCYCFFYFRKINFCTIHTNCKIIVVISKNQTFQLVNLFSLTLKVKINIKEERKSN